MTSIDPASRPTLTVPPGPRHARIHGIGAYRPERVVGNEEIVGNIDSSDEWIRSRSGIVTRHFARPDESVVDMAEAAARDAIEYAGLTPADIDLVVVACVTHLFQFPAVGPLLAARLGISSPAFDLAAGCAGYCHGIALGNDAVRMGTADHVLVVGVEKLSDMTDPHDRGTAFLLGDGAGAVVIGPSEFPGISPTVWGSDGTQASTIQQRESWAGYRDGTVDELGNPTEMTFPYMFMAGQTVFRWACFTIAPKCNEILDKAGIAADQLDAFVPHQANMRIIDQMIKVMRLPEQVPVARDIADMGNTSSASVPLAMERMLREGQAPHGGLALQVGFGSGLVFAGQVVVLP